MGAEGGPIGGLMRAAAALLAALVPGAAGAQLGDLYGRAWVRVAEPAAAEQAVQVPLVEVSGQAGARGLETQDVILAIDLSDSTLEPCGIDLDGDGEAGRTNPAMMDWLLRQPDVRERLLDRVASEDFDDSVLMAELAAAYSIVSQADARALRVGIVAFSTHGWVVAPLGSSNAELVEALDHLHWNFFYDLGYTDFASGLDAAAKAFDAQKAASKQRSIVFLSDGANAGMRPRWDVEERALEAARRAAQRDLRVFAYALGPEAKQELDVYRGMAELTGGRFEQLDRPTEAVARLAAIDFAEVADLEVENATNGTKARALRTFPDGTFDALVALAPGPNRLRFTARAKNGTSEVAERTVRYDRPAAQTAEERAAEERRMAELAEQLRERTAETRLIADMGKRKPVQRREIELRAEAARRAERASQPVFTQPPLAPSDVGAPPKR
jgi:hypothetical protein